MQVSEVVLRGRCMKKILVVGVIGMMAFGAMAQPIDNNPANERFQQRSTNFGGTALNAKSRAQTTQLPHKYVMYRRPPSSQNNFTNSSTNTGIGSASHFNSTANSYNPNNTASNR